MRSFDFSFFLSFFSSVIVSLSPTWTLTKFPEKSLIFTIVSPVVLAKYLASLSAFFPARSSSSFAINFPSENSYPSKDEFSEIISSGLRIDLVRFAHDSLNFSRKLERFAVSVHA